MAKIDREQIFEELETARLMALELGVPNAAVSATMGKAKIAGLIVEKREVGGPGDFSNLTDDQLIAEMYALEDEIKKARRLQ